MYIPMFQPYVARHMMRLAAVMAVALLLTSCGGILYDDEGDCDPVYRLRLRYDMNLKFADAFAHEVRSVRLFAFDADGRMVWQTEESGDRLADEDYDIVLPLPPGSYSLTAWCGLDNGESFTLPAATGDHGREDLHCRLNRTYGEDGGAVSDSDLHPLFHGSLDVELPDDPDGGTYSYVMPLTKDTNVFRIVLQHMSGEDLDVNDFSFHIEDCNGWLAHDNSLRDDETVTYRAWSGYSGSAGVDLGESLYPAGEGSRAITDVKVAVAELTTSRLMARGRDAAMRPMLTIRRVSDGDLVARIPVIDYALLVKGNLHRQMSDQEYLDRQDEYNMTFLLDENCHWLATSIIINSWTVVLNPSDLD